MVNGNFRVLSVFGISLLVTVFQGLTLPEHSWAASITCNLPYTTPCTGTNGQDNMLGNKLDNGIFGLGGNDLINASSGNDIVYGMLWNDTIYGQRGNDFLLGGIGADKISGGNENDKIFHNSNSSATSPDKYKDFIDCGSGNDEVWINVKVDHDSAKNCEVIHPG